MFAGWLLSCLLLAAPEAMPAVQDQSASIPTARMILVIGAPGEETYAEQFAAWAEKWEQAAAKGGATLAVIGREDGGPADRDRLQAAVVEAAKSAPRELWIVLIGHGTFDRRTAKFNLRGPDVAASDLKTWLADVKSPTAIIDCSAASAPFLQTLAGPNRIVISATKSGGEQNFARFGEYLSQAIADPAADLDKDDQTSLWESYLAASRKTDEFYKTDGRLQTEHPLLDDNGDGQGTRSDAFRGLEPVQDADDGKSALDGVKAHQWHLVPSAAESKLPVDIRRRRDDIELQILMLRTQKTQLSEDEYYDRLEALVVELSRLSQGTKTPSDSAQR
ncbi:MAG: hypothetical protein SH850_20320 [Planctomycetaceae bacterium]|nr:hypothetical protein [Planctomycetaceae bacterium]